MSKKQYKHHFRYETELVDAFISCSRKRKSKWVRSAVVREFNYSRGKTDILLVSQAGEVIAIEAKLSDWKNAAHQAYKSHCFANKSYILLPEEVIAVAFKRIEEIYKRRIGILTIKNNNIEVVVEAEETKPLQPWLHAEAIKIAYG